ncbi:uncharacterized protein LOC114252241 [Bombyx mandarina]|uniref:Uncharacterized protein LOC114252241 n=1 Tax=Bombyx mandarina TaxID=7092 RepID=A0A6J2KLX6_BOMMA|nr:uncharacterized protein LOC114252241 [Bombyx mandarina]
MYRQVLVHEDDRDLQLILWREDESMPIETLRLNTLTYGTASASYLSTRCLWQVGEECTDETIKTIIQRDFFVDDLITGSDDELTLRYIQTAISQALNSACFKLRKYKSNLPTIFDNSFISVQENLALSESSSTLGIGWSPSSDCIHFPIKFPHNTNTVTKRTIMSDAFKIFDPLGILSPCIIKPKMILQELWILKLDWDQPVPHDVKTEWYDFINNLKFISEIQIPRRVLCDSPIAIEVHSFSDASQRAYGACIYIKSIDCNNVATVNLLCSKSKVAPLKPVTIPRLELCAALLAAKLCKSVLDSIRYVPSRSIFWCDSSVVLGWLNSNPAKLKTFVANRVVETLETSKSSSWRYVPTDMNPADLISRGVNANKLQNMSLWWSGPAYLGHDETHWPVLNPTKLHEELPEIKQNIKTKHLPNIYAGPAAILKPVIKIENYSKINKLKGTLGYINRFIYNSKNPKNKLTGRLSIEEINNSFTHLCKIAQKQSFTAEYNSLRTNKILNPKSKILPLSPLIDKNNLIRVGGRINASNYSYDKKHPILLDSSHHLTRLIFEHEHIRNMHAGPQLLLATVREYVWPLNGRRLARRTVYRCVRCRRIQGKTLIPKMGDLPAPRINPDFPFLSVGLDFAGPFLILNRKGRGAKLIKCYLCVFVCLRYKCLHLEAVSDLSKDAFIMTLRRFISRRGKPIEIYCDNGRNFVAAARELSTFLQNNKEPLFDFATQETIKFIFSPTYAPHFGGIWEAGVKSAKHHIKRVIGNAHLTFEEISTLFAQVEAILNSRPLCPLSCSPDDLLSLSPGHFLIGRPLTALPSPALQDHNQNTLQRYARVEQLRQHFWQRWQKEYISELQQRTKWRTNAVQLDVGDLVLLQEDHVPPMAWRLGRVLRLFPGPDGISRVADISTTRGCVRRPLIRICPLPSAQDLQG